MTAARLALAMAAVGVLGGCATKSDIRDIQNELRTMAARQDTLFTQIRMVTLSTRDTLATQADQLFDFRGEVTRQLREIAQGMARLQALTGESQRSIIAMRDRLANTRTSPGGGAPIGPVQSDTARDETVAGVGGGNAEQLWRVATDQLARGSLTTAQRAFEQFIREHPNHALAPDAHFFLADILAQQNRPEEALEAFQQVPELFPTAAKVPDALYRIAILQIELDDVDAARVTLQRIVNTYPESPIALIARDKLEEIGG
jgi:tol-pal system protein YbgF